MSTASDDSLGEEREFALQVLHGLLASIQAGREAPLRWDLAEPYLLRQAISHAVDAGLADELLTDPEFLVHADPETLLPALRQAVGQDARLLAAIYRASSRFHQVADPTARRQLLSVDAARYGAGELSERLSSPRAVPLGLWAPAWSTSAQVDQALLLTIQQEAWIRTVAVAELGARPIVVVGGDDRLLRVYDLATGEAVGLPLTGHSDVVRAVATGMVDGRTVVVSGGDDGKVRLWDLASGEPVRFDAVPDRNPLEGRINASRRPILCVAVTAGEENRSVLVAGGEDRVIRVWDLYRDETTGRVLDQPRELREHAMAVTALATGTLAGRPVVLSGSQDKTVRLWDLASGRAEWVLRDHDSWVHTVALVEVAGLTIAVSAGSDAVILVHELPSGRELANLPGHTASIGGLAAIAMEEQLRILSAGSDETVRIHDVAVLAPHGYQWTSRLLTGHTRPVGTVAAGELDGRPIAVSGGGDATVRVWDLTVPAFSERSGPQPTGGHTNNVGALAIGSIQARPVLLSGGDDGALWIWNLQDGRGIAGLSGDRRHGVPGSGEGEVRSLATALVDGQLVFASGGSAPVLRRWALQTPPPSEPTAHPTIVELSDGGAHTDELEMVNAVTIAPIDGRPTLVSGGDDAALRLWDLSGGHSRGILEGHTDWVTTLATGPGGLIEGRPILASGSNDGSVRIWDLDQYRQLGPPLLDDADTINAVALTELQGRPVAAAGGDDTKIRLWDLADGRVLRILTGHVQPVQALAVVDGSRPLLVSGGDDATLRIWDLTTGRPVTSLALPDRILALAAAPDGTIAVAFGWEVAVFRPTIRRADQ